MALDTIAIHYLVKEMHKELKDAKIEKVHQPEKDEILLIVKGFGKALRLVISANASQPRIHFTKTQKDNPLVPPMFCMLLRKHLQGGRIKDVKQIDYERIIRFDIESYDELGDLSTKYLFCEIMGRHSNIILTKEDLTVIDSIKHIDFSLSSVRQILPGIVYILPPKQDKVAILSPDLENVQIDFSKEGKRPDKAILESLTGISPVIAREAVFKVLGKLNVDCFELNDEERIQLLNEVKKISEYKFSPCMLTESKSGNVIDFCVFDIKQYQELANKKEYKTINELLDDFFVEKDSVHRMKQKSSDIVHILNINIERISKKISILKATLSDAENKEKYKEYGDLLTANIYKLKQGESEICVENYYDDMNEVTIALNPSLSPSMNCQRYYKLYQKAKNAQIEAKKQLDRAVIELEYLESALVLALNAQNEGDLNLIREELTNEGYIKRHNNKKMKKQETAKPHHYLSSDGFDIYVGRNNTQNDWLTLRFANSMDLWFHTKKIHGSHTVIKLGTNKEIPRQTIIEAAQLAAYYSKARESSNVAVDYTFIKNVKKPNGAKPGMVIYDSYNTVYVNPKLSCEK